MGGDALAQEQARLAQAQQQVGGWANKAGVNPAVAGAGASNQDAYTKAAMADQDYRAQQGNAELGQQAFANALQARAAEQAARDQPIANLGSIAKMLGEFYLTGVLKPSKKKNTPPDPDSYDAFAGTNSALGDLSKVGDNFGGGL